MGCTLYTVHCTVYIVHCKCILYSVHCTVYIVDYHWLISIEPWLCFAYRYILMYTSIVQCTPGHTGTLCDSIHCIAYTDVHYTVYSVLCTLYSVDFARYAVYLRFYIVS